jgi:PIN domain nuclease of toxin-antitoxin system
VGRRASAGLLIGVVVLDTHVWIWWADDPARLSATAREAIDQADSIGIASISCWEVAMLSLGGRVTLDRDIARWVRQALAQPGVVAVPLTPKVAVDAALLEREGFSGDPADRLIYATARDVGARLVTRDERIRGFDARGTVW